MMATEMMLTAALNDQEAKELYASTNKNAMIQVLHNYWDNVCLQGLAITPTGDVINVRATWAHAPMLTMYDVTNGCYINCSDWEWNYTDF